MSRIVVATWLDMNTTSIDAVVHSENGYTLLSCHKRQLVGIERWGTNLLPAREVTHSRIEVAARDRVMSRVAVGDTLLKRKLPCFQCLVHCEGLRGHCDMYCGAKQGRSGVCWRPKLTTACTMDHPIVPNCTPRA